MEKLVDTKDEWMKETTNRHDKCLELVNEYMSTPTTSATEVPTAGSLFVHTTLD